MSDFVPFPPPESVEALYLVGFRIDPSVEGPQFYTLFALEGDNDRPITRKARVLFFTNPRSAKSALKQADNAVQSLAPPDEQVEMVCDVAEVLYMLNSQSEDPDGLVLECIGCLDDMIRAVRLNVPAQYMSLLSALSERLMSNHEFGSWIEEKGIDREQLEDAIMWCVGAVTVKSSWIT